MIKLLVGNIASGKTTFCKEAALEGDVIVGDDPITMMLHGGNYRLWNKELVPLYKSVEHHIVHAGVLAGRNVVIDKTNMTRETRAKYIALARSMEVDIIAYEFPQVTPHEHAERRFNADNRDTTHETWLTVAEKFALMYEKPQLEEGFSDIIYIGNQVC